MIQKLRTLITSVLLVGLFATGVSLVMPAKSAFADAASEACAGLKVTNPDAKCDDGSGGGGDAEADTGKLVKTIVNVLSWIVGVAAVIMIIIGGLRYVLSGGDSNGVSGAKNTILYAIVGLVIVLFAQVIVAFVLTNVTKDPGSGGGGTTTTAPDGTKTTTTKNPDGSTTTTTTSPDGSTTTSTTPASGGSGGDTNADSNSNTDSNTNTPTRQQGN